MILDLKRLQELEKLSGLQLDPAERERLLADLSDMEKFVSELPDVPDSHDISEVPDGGKTST